MLNSLSMLYLRGGIIPILITTNDIRYDELEQQAMEQYRTSEESLALKYQVR